MMIGTPPAPKPYKMRTSPKRIAIFDTETDPFSKGRAVAPFTCGFYDGETYADFWGDDCIAQFFAWLAANFDPDELMIYAHNGGKFDFFMCLDYMDTNQYPSIINGRLTKLRLGGFEFRDSFAIIPVALAVIEKTKIDYAKFERDVRARHEKEIRSYQRDDCMNLYRAVIGFHDLFGDKLTIGSTALPILRSYHGFDTMTETTDAAVRPFYFGGRVQAFEIGVLHGAWSVYDVTSMYPHVMQAFKHPVSSSYFVRRDLNEKVAFAKITARNYGALPLKDERGRLTFDVEHGTFFATMHEIQAGLETGTLEIERIHYALQFTHMVTFAEFVESFFAKRRDAQAAGDDLGNIFYKLILNSSYGKFAQDPSKYRDYAITLKGIPSDERGLWNEHDNPKGWQLDAIHGEAKIWKAVALNPGQAYKNVATAASITGAARAQMLRGLAAATRPVYCDTDSLICESFSGDIGRDLGQWKLEAEGDRVAIGGKKIYAAFKGPKEIKSACKGADLDAFDVEQIAKGEVIEWTSKVPNFKRDQRGGKAFGRQEFVTRKIRATGKPLRVSKRHVAKLNV